MAWAPDYVTVAELSAYLRISDSDDDVQLAVAVTAASRTVDRFCSRQFGKVDVVQARTFDAQYDRASALWTLPVDDFYTADGLIVATSAGEILTGVVPGPRNAVVKGRPYGSISGAYGVGLSVAAAWGWEEVPAAVKQAVLIQAARFMARRDSPYGIAGSPSEGSEMRLISTLDPDVKVSLDPYRRTTWWAA